MPESPAECSTSECQRQALLGRMEPGSASRENCPRIRLHDTSVVLPRAEDDSHECRPAIRPTAAHTRALRLAWTWRRPESSPVGLHESTRSGDDRCIRALGVGPDVDAPTRELCGEPGVLPFSTDGQGELIVGHDDPGGPQLTVDDLHRGDP